MNSDGLECKPSGISPRVNVMRLESSTSDRETAEFANNFIFRILPYFIAAARGGKGVNILFARQRGIELGVRSEKLGVRSEEFFNSELCKAMASRERQFPGVRSSRVNLTLRCGGAEEF